MSFRSGREQDWSSVAVEKPENEFVGTEKRGIPMAVLL
jgi:hypothetical protein